MVGYDAGKRVKGRKRHLVTDTLGLLLRIEVHSASVQDRDGAALVLDRITRRFPFLERFFADAGYQGPRVAAAAPRAVEIIKRSSGAGRGTELAKLTFTSGEGSAILPCHCSKGGS